MCILLSELHSKINVNVTDTTLFKKWMLHFFDMHTCTPTVELESHISVTLIQQ